MSPPDSTNDDGRAAAARATAAVAVIAAVVLLLGLWWAPLQRPGLFLLLVVPLARDGALLVRGNRTLRLLAGISGAALLVVIVWTVAVSLA